MSEPIPPSYDDEPIQMSGGIVYTQAKDGRWYPVQDPATKELCRWPSNAVLGKPETRIRPIGIRVKYEGGRLKYYSVVRADPLPDTPAIVEAR